MFPTPVPLAEALQLDPGRPVSLLEKRSTDVLYYSKGLRSVSVPERLEIGEAASLFEVWSDNKALHTGSLAFSLCSDSY